MYKNSYLPFYLKTSILLLSLVSFFFSLPNFLSAQTAPQITTLQGQAGASKLGGLPRVVYGFDREFPPFSFENPGGKATGFEVELLELLFKDRAKLFYRPLNWNMVQLELAEGKIQITSGMVETKERAKLFYFSKEPTFRTSIVAFTKVYNRIPNLTFLRGQPVAVEKGSYQQRLLEDFGGINIKLYPTKSDALFALANDDVAAYCGPRESTYFMLRKLNITAVTTVSTPFGFTDMRFAISKERPDLLKFVNDRMDEVVKSGEYNQLYRRWFVQELNEIEIKALIDKAKEASLAAYAPFSNKNMGAAVLTATGNIYIGCNVENAQKELTLSALQGALARTVSEKELEIRAALMVDANGNIVTPSATDYQSFYQLNPGTLFVIEPEKNKRQTYTAAELLLNPTLPKPIDLNIE
ncbi:transporter substrate-binding domain-containing protein [Desulfovibrio litoralis]|uniref:Cytidine deaminase n=1 Tax=Desulfovibrio litoralis DSM 11393 TaxID=1121455 RepID=A0A1M7TBC5_9BACT|nr:transporter substrate-binding domain-containing protein [Desulfovibrio litoralis]SHN68005.1 cytidine deaminase [Desulfovibrio litoralis DSM 11393]